ncbi:uncharacterized protein LOC143889606 [Tasmannia lanceolata]|uniref:uncharacterized protein LOC143889606 n=1 Tax=Tasmannia lanceolata TaxID=3420 RepID=UPI004064588F
MRVKGYTKHRPVSILIDSGSTHNFVDPRVAKRTGCKFETTLPLKVTVANGQQVRSDAVCKNFQWVMHGSEFCTDVRLLRLGGYDVVFGTLWLETLGDIIWNFSKLRIEFCINGKRHGLRGAKAGSVHSIGRDKMVKILKKQGHGALTQLYAMIEVQKTEPLEPELSDLLHEFQGLFNEPTTLPPARTQDHRIPLQPGTLPINVRPYRYPYKQKKEIEKLVREMLQNGCCAAKHQSFFVTRDTVYSRSWKDHIQHLRATFQLLEQHQLHVKRSKCTFGQQKLEYLGHIISEQGVATDPSKIESMLKWLKPRTLKALRGFLGLTGYYR